MYLAGTFHCLLGPVRPPTADQCVRPGAWSVGAPCGCLPRGGFCWIASSRACWNIHALQAKKHVWCSHAMTVPTLQEPDSDPWAADSQNWRWPRMCETSWDAWAAHTDKKSANSTGTTHMPTASIFFLHVLVMYWKEKAMYYVCICKFSLRTRIKTI